jgi:hypothetical protein
MEEQRQLSTEARIEALRQTVHGIHFDVNGKYYSLLTPARFAELSNYVKWLTADLEQLEKRAMEQRKHQIYEAVRHITGPFYTTGSYVAVGESCLRHLPELEPFKDKAVLYPGTPWEDVSQHDQSWVSGPEPTYVWGGK